MEVCYVVTYPAFSDQQALLLSVNQEFLVPGMCPIVGMGDSEKAAGEEIRNQLLLAPGPCPEGQNGKRYSPMARILGDPHFM